MGNNAKEARQQTDSATSFAVLLKNNFVQQRDLSRRISSLAVAGFGVGLLGLALAAVSVLSKPQPSYFAVSPTLSVIQLTPLSEPYISKQGLLDWTAESVSKTLALDFAHYREQLNEVMPDYTPDGYKQVVAQLEDSGTLKMIKTQRVVTSAIPTAAPVIVAAGVLNGVYAWKIQFPLVVSYETSGNSSNRQSLVATVTVTRVPTVYNPRGVAIAQLNLLQANGQQ